MSIILDNNKISIIFPCIYLLIEPHHVSSNNVALVKSKGYYRTVEKCSLTRAFACHINHLWSDPSHRANIVVSDYPVRIQLLIGFSHLCKVEFLSLWIMNAFQKGLLLSIDFRIDSSTTENEGRESEGGAEIKCVELPSTDIRICLTII